MPMAMQPGNQPSALALVTGASHRLGRVLALELGRQGYAVGLHYNTFPPIKIDEPAAIERFRAAHKNLHLLLPGESHSF